MEYEAVIGFEIHAQLLTKSKMFCRCDANYSAVPPNMLICPVCAGLPGSLPVPNETALEFAVTTALALNCQIEQFSKWDRKSYFYPDLPKGYQISQYDMPLGRNGWITVVKSNKETKKVSITRVHLEEDTGKLYHVTRDSEGYSLVDFNRAGIPLLEVVSEPDIRSAEEARLYVMALRDILVHLGICSGKLEQGALRCEANISLRPTGSTQLGTKVEVKNMNSFRAVERAVQYEIARQAGILDKGGSINQQTRGWSEKDGITVEQRSKEAAHEYRYFPEPDIPPIILSEEYIDRLRQALPEMPDRKRIRFTRDYGLPESDANLLAGNKFLADFFEASVALYHKPKVISNWLLGELSYLLNEADIEIQESGVSPNDLVELLRLLDKGRINRNTAKVILEQVFNTGQAPQEIVSQRDLSQISGRNELRALINRVLEDYSKAVGDYRSGKKEALGFLLGQVMKVTSGKANPAIVRELLEEALQSLEPQIQEAAED